jgi:methylthioribose-1-phosphate isomerase
VPWGRALPDPAMRTVQFENNALRLIDQTRLPHELRFVECTTAAEVAEAIRRMQVRGAPAIGVSAAYGVALGAREYAGDDWAGLLAHLERVGAMLEATRPTAVNLSWAVRQMLTAARIMALTNPIESAPATLLALAHQMADEDVAVNRRMGANGADLVPDDSRVLTHCNAGALACVDYGTAIGVIRSAAEQGKRIRVFVDETRPFLQGARLTAWELQQAGLPVTLIADSMAGHFISRGEVDLVVVGADRVAANGDVANKIGTYTLAVLCKENDVPFYVAAPTSTIDLAVPDGAAIPIEERSPEEVTHLAGQPIAPPGVGVANPAFDVTPARYVTAIITEHGVCRPPYEASLREAAGSAGVPPALLGQADR